MYFVFLTVDMFITINLVLKAGFNLTKPTVLLTSKFY